MAKRERRNDIDYPDLRSYLALIESKGLLKHVKKEVDKDWELSCIARWVCQSFEGDQGFGLISPAGGLAKASLAASSVG